MTRISQLSCGLMTNSDSDRRVWSIQDVCTWKQPALAISSSSTMAAGNCLDCEGMYLALTRCCRCVWSLPCCSRSCRCCWQVVSLRPQRGCRLRWWRQVARQHTTQRHAGHKHTLLKLNVSLSSTQCTPSFHWPSFLMHVVSSGR